jgi:hypothetical protein
MGTVSDTSLLIFYVFHTHTKGKTAYSTATPQPNQMSCRQQDVILWAVYFTLVTRVPRSYMKTDSIANQNDLQWKIRYRKFRITNPSLFPFRCNRLSATTYHNHIDLFPEKMFGNEEHVLSSDKTLFKIYLSGFRLFSRSTRPDKQLGLRFFTSKLVKGRVCYQAFSTVLAVLWQTKSLDFLKYSKFLVAYTFACQKQRLKKLS